MRLRSNLFSLVVATALPLVAFAVLVSMLLLSHERENFVDAVQSRNRAFLSAVDAELAGHVMTLRALTTLPSIAGDDLAAVHADLTEARTTQPNWVSIVLLAPDGRQLVNTIAPYGASLPFSIELESVRKAVETMQPVIGNGPAGRLKEGFGVPIRVPVVRDKRVVYVLSAAVRIVS